MAGRTCLKYTALVHTCVFVGDSFLDPDISSTVGELLPIRVHTQLQLHLPSPGDSLVLLGPDQALLDQPLGELGRGVDEEPLHLGIQLRPLGRSCWDSSLWLGRHGQSWESFSDWLSSYWLNTRLGQVNHLG